MSALIGCALVLPALAACSPLAGEAPAEGRASGSVSPPATPSATPSPVLPEVARSNAALGSAPVQTLDAPVHLRFERLSVDMTVTPESVDAAGAMALPKNAADAGWYRFSPGLGEATGATVIAAHIDSWHDGIGPFSRLKNAVAGDTLTLSGSSGSTDEYTVTEVRQVGKIDAPMAEVFDLTGPPRVALVTCGGVFNSKTGHYLDNVIVTAVPTSPAPARK